MRWHQAQQLFRRLKIQGMQNDIKESADEITILFLNIILN